VGKIHIYKYTSNTINIANSHPISSEFLLRVWELASLEAPAAAIYKKGQNVSCIGKIGSKST
jgi:hypothetical protein